LEGIYQVLLDKENVGKVSVERQGLYYRVQCCCELKNEQMYRLRLHWADKERDLGLLVPDGKNFVVRTRFPVKDAGTGAAEFYLHDPSRRKQEFIPIIPDEPFEQLEQLKDSVLVEEDGAPGIVKQDETLDSREDIPLQDLPAQMDEQPETM